MKIIDVGAVLFALAALLFAANHNLQTGKILDAKSAVIYDAASKITDTQWFLVGNEFTYILADSKQQSSGIPFGQPIGAVLLSRQAANRKHGCRFIVGDAVQYEQQKSKITIRDADGKECSLEIIRQERLQK